MLKGLSVRETRAAFGVFYGLFGATDSNAMTRREARNPTTMTLREKYLQFRVAPSNLNAGSVPWNPGEHVWPHAVPHQAREQEEDKGQLERNQEKHILVIGV